MAFAIQVLKKVQASWQEIFFEKFVLFHASPSTKEHQAS
jgi:hypothetical protein